jgi:hypothetical protein
MNTSSTSETNIWIRFMRIPGRYARRNFVAVLYDRVRTNELTQLKKSFFTSIFFLLSNITIIIASSTQITDCIRLGWGGGSVLYAGRYTTQSFVYKYSQNPFWCWGSCFEQKFFTRGNVCDNISRSATLASDILFPSIRNIYCYMCENMFTSFCRT